MPIHATSIIHPDASVAQSADIGPYCVIGKNVVLGEHVKLHSHVVIEGRTQIATKTEIFPFASIGHKPQDLKFENEPSSIEIGAHCTIREHVTVNPGTKGGAMVTKVGDHCLLMVGAHVAHDCDIGDHVILANNVALAGHVTVGDYAIFGGLSAAHQFVRVGHHAFIGFMSGIENDVIPYGSAIGNRAHLGGLNLVGLRRRGFDRQSIHQLRSAYRMIFASEGTLSERIEDAQRLFSGQQLVEEVIKFIRDGNDRAICTPRHSVVGSN